MYFIKHEKSSNLFNGEKKKQLSVNPGQFFVYDSIMILKQ